MATMRRISPAVLHALKEALILVFWYKKDLRGFLTSCLGRSELIADVDWTDYKRAIVAKLVDSLAADQHRHFDELLTLILATADITDPSHLKRIEDGEQNYTQAVTALKTLTDLFEPYRQLRSDDEEANRHCGADRVQDEIAARGQREAGGAESLLLRGRRAAGSGSITGHAFISYVREDSRHVDQLQRALQAAGVPVWRDTADLWPGEDWRAEIRRAITDNALVFIACFSQVSLSRGKTYQNEELTLAIEQLRLRPPDNPWLIPVRFDECDIPERDIGGGRTLGSIQRADLFGNRSTDGTERLVAVVLRILGHQAVDAAVIPRARWPAGQSPQFAPGVPANCNVLLPEISVATIIGQTASYFGLSVDDFLGTSRSRVAVVARQIAIYLCRELTELSLRQIGQCFGGRDATTVMRSVGKIRSLMAERRSIYYQVTALCDQIKQQTLERSTVAGVTS